MKMQPENEVLIERRFLATIRSDSEDFCSMFYVAITLKQIGESNLIHILKVVILKSSFCSFLVKRLCYKYIASSRTSHNCFHILFQKYYFYLDNTSKIEAEIKLYLRDLIFSNHVTLRNPTKENLKNTIFSVSSNHF